MNDSWAKRRAKNPERSSGSGVHMGVSAPASRSASASAFPAAARLAPRSSAVTAGAGSSTRIAVSSAGALARVRTMPSIHRKPSSVCWVSCARFQPGHDGTGVARSAPTRWSAKSAAWDATSSA